MFISRRHIHVYVCIHREYFFMEVYWLYLWMWYTGTNPAVCAGDSDEVMV